MIEGPAGGSTSWSRRSSEVMFSSDWFEVRRDETRRPDGSWGTYDHVVVPGSVTVLAVDDGMRLAVIRQWIYVHRAMQWRLPTGRIEPSDPDPEAAARRELREETGISADQLVRLGTINCADSFTNLREHAFLATGLRLGDPEPEAGEGDIELHWMRPEQVLGLVRRGELPHAGSSFAVLSAHTFGAIPAAE